MLRGSLITEMERTQTLSLTHKHTGCLEHISGKLGQVNQLVGGIIGLHMSLFPVTQASFI